MFKSTIQITVLSVVTILLSFVTQIAVAYYFGATSERDAYFAALVIPTYISAVLLGSIGFMFLPIYVDIRTNKGDVHANCFLNNTLTFSACLSVLIILIGTIWSKKVIMLTAPGFKEEQIVLTSNLLAVLLPSIAFQMISSIAGSVLQANHKFLLAATAPVISSLITLLVVLLLSQRVGIHSLAYGTLIGSLAAVFFMLMGLRKEVQLQLIFSFKNSDLLNLISKSLPLLTAGIFYRITGLFERSIASSLEKGSISYLGYANQIMLILATLTSAGIATTIYPLMSKAWSENNLEQLRDLLIKGVRIVLLLTVPVSVIFIFWGVPIFQMLFERGAFTHASTLAISSAFSFLTIALIANSLGGLVAKIFYFSQKTLLGSCFEVVSTVFYLVFAYFLSQTYSFNGLAMASSLSAVISIAISFATFYVMVKGIDIWRIVNAVVVSLFASLLPIISIIGLIKVFAIDNNSLISLIICIVLFLTGYYFLLYFFRTKEIALLQSQIKQYLIEVKKI